MLIVFGIGLIDRPLAARADEIQAAPPNQASAYDLRVSDKKIVAKDPGPGEVRIKIMAAGLCHSDLSVIDGTIPYPVPVVLGHEGAGVIDAVGVGVRSVREGDTVIVSTLSHCGRCAKCDAGHPTECKNAPSPKDAQPFTVRGKPAFQFANASVFAEYTVVREQGAIPLKDHGLAGRVLEPLRIALHSFPSSIRSL